jgi:purine-binding chemotaxis protein CheW
MNLADIRKKSETVKKVDSEQGDSAVALEQPDIAEEFFEDQQYEDEPHLRESVILAWEGGEEVLADCVTGAKVEEDERIDEIIPDGVLSELSPRKPTVNEAVSSVSDDFAPPVRTALPPSSRVKSAGYDPLATIISGREWSADSEDASLYGVLPTVSGVLEEYLCFRVANEEYAINIMAIKEIIKPRDVTEVPRMPEFISGVISLRGIIIPIMDMRLRLALPSVQRTGRERVVVLRKGTGFCGVFVDEVLQVARINKADIEAPPAVLDGIDRDFVKGLGRFDKRMLILLNLETILDVSIN